MEPAESIEACETALRQLMTVVYPTSIGHDWLKKSVTEERQAKWEERQTVELAKRGKRGVATTSTSTLDYLDLFELRDIAWKNWTPLKPALGERAETAPLLKRLDDLRNTVAHNRPLVPFERDLVAGIAGEIRNRVTIFMSTTDPAGDIYPRVEFIQDNFGNYPPDLDPNRTTLDTVCSTDLVVHEGDILTVTCRGSDPQQRDLLWTIVGSGMPAVKSADGETIEMSYKLVEKDVRETYGLKISMAADGTKYHRTYSGDQNVIFFYHCRPPRKV